MILSDLHVHTVFSDGTDTPKKMVEAAIHKGMTRVGFSDHSPITEDEYWCMRENDVQSYKTEINRLKEEYKRQIEILCGIEQDFASGMRQDGFDYAIGSVHFVRKGTNLLPVDESEEVFVKIVKDYFDGDFYEFARLYYEDVARVVDVTGADIIGHFDLVTKFNEGNRLFDEFDPRYVSFSRKAADALIKSKKPFEINTGAISRGYRKTPYPSESLIDYIRQNGGKFILSSDCHSCDTLCYEFEKYKYLTD